MPRPSTGPRLRRFNLEKDFEGTTEQGYYYSAYKYSAAEHGGTHIDAPVHFAKGRNTVDEIPLEQLMGPASWLMSPDNARRIAIT